MRQVATPQLGPKTAADRHNDFTGPARSACVPLCTSAPRAQRLHGCSYLGSNAYLWAVRLAERLSLAILWGAGVGITAAGARLLWPRNHWWATGALCIALFAGAWLSFRSRRYGRGVLTPGLVQTAAALTGIVVIAAEIILNLSGPGAGLPPWSFIAGVIGLFAIAAVSSVRIIDRRSAAIFVDQQAGLEERVSTALNSSTNRMLIPRWRRRSAAPRDRIRCGRMPAGQASQGRLSPAQRSRLCRGRCHGPGGLRDAHGFIPYRRHRPSRNAEIHRQCDGFGEEKWAIC